MRLGCTPYLNALPLTYGLAGQRDIELTHASPARLADLLRQRELDAALVSSNEYFADDYLIIGGGALSSGHPDADAILCAHVPFTHIRTVALSTASRSTNLLLQVLMQRLCPGSAVRYELRPEDTLRSLSQFDACLLTGDIAVTLTRKTQYKYGLAELWREQTGLPMVFSLWLAQPDADEAIAKVVQQSMQRGSSQLSLLAIEAAEQRKLDRGLVTRYLTEALDFGWTSEHERALIRFGEELQAMGIIPRTRPLAYLGDPLVQPAPPAESSHST